MLQSVTKCYKQLQTVTYSFPTQGLLQTVTKTEESGSKDSQKMEWNIKGCVTLGLLRRTLVIVHKHLCVSHSCRQLRIVTHRGLVDVF